MVQKFFSSNTAYSAVLLTCVTSEDYVPTRHEYHENGDSLVKALAPHASVFLAYGGTFVSTGLLWHVHHSLLHVSTRFKYWLTV